MTPATTTPETELTPELIGRVMKLSPENLGRLVGLALDHLGASDAPDEVAAAWRDEIARRIEDMRTGRVETIDAQGSAARLLQNMLRKYGP